jgi:protein transport protein SEC13
VFQFLIIFNFVFLPLLFLPVQDRTVKVYNVSDTSYEISATLLGHHGAVWQVSWAHPKFGVLLASCSFDGSVIVHREQRPGSWSILHHATALHESSVNGVAFAPHEFGLMFATASSDGRVAVVKHLPNHTWSVEYISDCPVGVNAVCWAPYGSYINMSAMSQYMDPSIADDDTNLQSQPPPPGLSLQLPRIATAGCDNCMRIYVCNEQGRWTLEYTTPGGATSTAVGHTDWVRDVAWAPCLLPNYNTIATCSEDSTVIVWNQAPPSSSSESTPSSTMTTANGSEWVGTVMHTFDDPVWRLSWSVTGHLLAVSSGDSNVTLWKASLNDRSHWIQVPTTSDPSTETQ